MIRVEIVRNRAGSIESFCVTGHANTAPHGADIVCAGVSALTDSAVLGLERYLGRKLTLQAGSGLLAVNLAAPPDERTDAILETMLLGIKEIARLYPRIVRIVEHGR